MGMETLEFARFVFVRGAASAVPLVFAASGELIGERAGLINIGLEGTMLTGAFVAAAAAWWTGSAWGGVIAAGAAGAIVGLLMAVWTVAARRDQIVTGLGINLLAVGLTGVAVQRIEHVCAARAEDFVPQGLAAAAPFDVMMLTALLLVMLIHVMLHYTRPGLTLRAVGENPHAADAAGVRVGLVRAAAAVFAGAMAGLGGAYLALGLTTRFQEEMTGGRGFLALALVIVGRWSPPGVLLAALVFGCLDALQQTLQPALGESVHLMYPALLALPYVATLVALAGFAGRAQPPAALAQPFERE